MKDNKLICCYESFNMIECVNLLVSMNVIKYTLHWHFERLEKLSIFERII